MNRIRLKKYLLGVWGSGYSSFAILLAIFLIAFVIPMAAERWVFTSIASQVLALILLIVGLISVSCGRVVRYVAFSSVIAAVIVKGIRELVHHEYLGVIEILLAILMLSVFAFLMIRQFLSSHNLIRDRIIGAVALYLLVGIIFARIYQLVFLVNPEAFHIHNNEGYPTMIYFSFVTLVTIGYGDIYPISLIARNVSIMEGVVGQLYVVILISSLVSESVTKSYRKE